MLAFFVFGVENGRYSPQQQNKGNGNDGEGVGGGLGGEGLEINGRWASLKRPIKPGKVVPTTTIICVAVIEKLIFYGCSLEC